MDPTTADILGDLGVALAIGLLIGLERGWVQRNVQAGDRAAGVRTFGLLGLAGGLLGLLGTGPAPWLAVVTSTGLTGLVVAGYWNEMGKPAARSITGAVVAIVTLCLGVLSVVGETRIAIIAGGTVVFLLSSRKRMHAWLRSLDDTDMRATAQFILVALVIFPLLPDDSFGPYGALNLHDLWLVVLFVTGISFAGYWASKRMGAARGTLVAATIGATYSSTAITAELARRLRKTDSNVSVLTAGIAAATSVMLIRVLVLCAILTPAGFATFAQIVAPAALAATAIAIVSAVRAEQTVGAPLPETNPFALWPAIGFAVTVAVVVIVSKWASERYGDAGLTVLLGLTGLYDVDSAIIAVSNLEGGTLSAGQSGLALAVAILANTLVKGMIVIVFAGPKMGIRAAMPLGLSAAILAIGYVIAR